MPLKLKKSVPVAGVETLLSTKEAATILGVAVSTLHNDRYQSKIEKTPPRYPFIRLPGGAIRYAVADLQAVIKAGRVGG